MITLSREFLKSRTSIVVEISTVFAAAVAIIYVGWYLVGDRLLARQGVVWLANVAMMTLVWLGLRVRGENVEQFGLSFKFPGWRSLVGNLIKSIVVFIVATASFMLGTAFTPTSGGTPQQADMSSYQWLQGNLPMLLFALAAVYIVSSFGEEFIYRGFLIRRVAEMGNETKAAYVFVVAFSAAVFGLVHFSWGIVGIIQTTLMGLALAVSFLLVKRLSILVLAHFYLDTLLLISIYAQ